MLFYQRCRSTLAIKILHRDASRDEWRLMRYYTICRTSNLSSSLLAHRPTHLGGSTLFPRGYVLRRTERVMRRFAGHTPTHGRLPSLGHPRRPPRIVSLHIVRGPSPIRVFVGSFDDDDLLSSTPPIEQFTQS